MMSRKFDYNGISVEIISYNADLWVNADDVHKVLGISVGEQRQVIVEEARKKLLIGFLSPRPMSVNKPITETSIVESFVRISLLIRLEIMRIDPKRVNFCEWLSEQFSWGFSNN